MIVNFRKITEVAQRFQPYPKYPQKPPNETIPNGATSLFSNTSNCIIQVAANKNVAIDKISKFFSDTLESF